MAMIGAFRCRHSGGYYPLEYVKEWGRKYGIGLGPVPVSECLNTNYQGDVVMNQGLGELHPVGVTKAELDFVMIDEAEFEKGKLILDSEDPGYVRRMAIIKEKQKNNPLSKIRK